MPLVIPYFIAHQGCPHQCLFCNQQEITGEIFSPGDIRRDIDGRIRQWLAYRKDESSVQFAFYGGSFTCLTEERQKAMLEAVSPWLEKGEIEMIRLSTRPDCIDQQRVALLQSHSVGIVELGVQSLDDRVLELSQRGHTSRDCRQAMQWLKKGGMEVGIQLMPGLPGETRSSFRRTVQQAIDLQPSFVRIYPAVVVKNSGLAELYHRNAYTPHSLNMAVLLTGWARYRFLENGIRIVRMGLQPSASLEASVLAGPYHPAFGEMVLSREWFKRTRKILADHPGRNIRLSIAAQDLSCFNGLHRSNRHRLQSLGVEQRLEVHVDKKLQRGSMHHVVC